MSEATSKSVTGPDPASTSWSSPSGLDLNPRPPQMVRISRRTSLALVAVAVVLLGLFAYGGWKRRQRQVAALADANLPKRVAPATAAAVDIEKAVPAGNVLTARTPQINPHVDAPGQLQAPQDIAGSPQSAGAAASDPASTVAYVRQAPPIQPAYVTPPAKHVYQPTPEEQRMQAAYDAEQRALEAPTSIRGGFGSYNSNPLVFPEQQKIIHITRVERGPQFANHKVAQRIHVNVGEELRGLVSEEYTAPPAKRREQANPSTALEARRWWGETYPPPSPED